MHLLAPLASSCATKVQGQTPDAAAALIPNTLQGIIAWLK
jgi:hypothetical protein